jgi:hypothetical protein
MPTFHNTKDQTMGVKNGCYSEETTQITNARKQDTKENT